MYTSCHNLTYYILLYIFVYYNLISVFPLVEDSDATVGGTTTSMGEPSFTKDTKQHSTQESRTNAPQSAAKEPSQEPMGSTVPPLLAQSMQESDPFQSAKSQTTNQVKASESGKVRFLYLFFPLFLQLNVPFKILMSICNI